jgi:hypothetical protein
MRVVNKHFHRGKNCPCCNRETGEVFSFRVNPIDRDGLCAHCFMEMIVEDGMELAPGGIYRLHDMCMPRRGCGE